MLVQIFASSACTGVVCTIGAPSASNSRAARSPERLADAADDARQRPDLLQEAVGGDPLRHVRDEHVLADREAALLLQVAGDELGRAGRDRRAQHEQLARAQHAAAGRRAPSGCRPCRSRCAKRRRAEREHDRVGSRGVGRARATRRASTRASSSSVPGSLNGIRRERTASSRSASLSIAEHAQAGVGERERERQADPAEADDRDVVASREEASGARGARAPTGARSRPRSAGCSAGSAATAGAAPGRAGTPTRGPSRCIQPGACGTSPAWKSNAAPTPTSTGASQPVAHPRHPLLLLGHADPDPHDVGAGALDVGRDGLLLGVGELAERRRVAADDLQPGMAQPQVARELDERALVAAAVEVHAPARSRAARAQARSIRSGP